eukprot:COSAG01_NODE_7502_length_3180_cov_2.210321_1_plen_250_part_10
MTTITATTLWLTDPDGKVLLLRKPSQAVFSEPGGKLEPGETPEEALVRECREEAGLELGTIAQQTGTKVFAAMKLQLFKCTLLGAAPVVTPSGEYSGGQAVWVVPGDIVTAFPPGGRCVCHGCDAMTATDQLFYFQRTNSHAWVCAQCKPQYEGQAGYTLRTRASVRLRQVLMDVQRAPGASFRDVGRVERYETAEYVPPVADMIRVLGDTPALLIDADCGLGKSSRIREFLEHLHDQRGGDLRILLVSV